MSLRRVSGKSKKKRRLLVLYPSVLFFFFFFFFFFFRATPPMTYGSSQARGQIRAASCQPISQPQQCRIQAMSAIYILAHSNIGIPMWFQCEARDQTCIFMDTSHICLCCTTMGPPLSVLFEMFCCIHALYLHVLFFYSFFFVFLLFLGPLPQHMEVPRLWIESEP